MEPIRLGPGAEVDPSDFEERFTLAGGPGGQNVNKVATAAQLRYDARRAAGLSEEVRARLEKLAGSRLTRDGVIVILARRHRSQERNRADARERLLALIQAAAQAPRTRRPTKPGKAAKRRRLEDKRKGAERKAGRRPVGGAD